MEKWWPVRVQFLWSISKQVRVILIELIRMSHPPMKLHMFMLQLTLPNQLALHPFTLGFIRYPSLNGFFTPFIIKLKCVSQLLRHNWMLFNRSWKKAFSYSCQKGGKQHIVRGRAAQEWKGVCILKGGVVCSHIFIPVFTVFLFMVIVLCFE